MCTARMLTALEFNQLPNEILVHLFSQLHFNELKNWRSVCKHWKDLIDRHIVIIDKQVFCKLFNTCLDPQIHPTFGRFLTDMSLLTPEKKESIIQIYSDYHYSHTLKQQTKKLRRLFLFDKPNCARDDEENAEDYTEIGLPELVCWSGIPILLGILLLVVMFAILMLSGRIQGPVEPAALASTVIGSILGTILLCFLGVISTSCISTRYCAHAASKQSESQARAFFGLFEAKTNQVTEFSAVEMSAVDPADTPALLLSS